MSKETTQWLNTNTLIGMTDERGTAWHWRAEEQGAESNHYAGAIPVGDVERRLFHWDAIKVPVQAVIPADFETMTGLNEDGEPVRTLTIPNQMAVMHPLTGKVFKIFSDGYTIHQYREWLIGSVSNLLGDSLVITSAGLLRSGGQAWVEVSIPETLHDDRTGFDYRPNLLAATSLDGTMSTTYGRTITATVCDNTMSAALGEMGAQKVKIRHSKYSGLRIGEAREAMSLVHETADQFEESLRELSSTTVTDAQFFRFLDEWAPRVDKKGDALEGAALTKATTKRDELVDMYRHDMRCAPWAGTKFGVVQSVNTWTQHKGLVRGASRTERNQEAAVKGEFDKIDGATLATIEKVLASV